MLVSGVSLSFNRIKVGVNPEEHDKWQTYHSDNNWNEAREPKLELNVCTRHENDTNEVADEKDL